MIEAARGSGRALGRLVPDVASGLELHRQGYDFIACSADAWVLGDALASALTDILKRDNVILTPHTLCWTDQCFAGNGAADVGAVLDVVDARIPRRIVNREIVDDPVWKDKLG